MVPVTRIVTMLMMAVICFALLLPLAMERHNPLLAAAIVTIFVLYLGANVLVWLRMRRRA